MTRTMARREDKLGNSFLVPPQHCGARMSLNRQFIARDRADGIRNFKCLICGERQEWTVDNEPHTA